MLMISIRPDGLMIYGCSLLMNISSTYMFLLNIGLQLNSVVIISAFSGDDLQRD